jgi:hypothetical protein
MDNLLENKIREHAAEIFGSEPMLGHRDRFAEKLQAVGGKKQMPIRKIIGYLSVAAVFAGCIFFVRDLFIADYAVEEESLYEVQTYYAMQLQDKIDDIEQLLQRLDEQDRATLISDIEAMQQEADLSIRESDEKNIELIVTTYSPKIETLEHIHNILSANY